MRILLHAREANPQGGKRDGKESKMLGRLTRLKRHDIHIHSMSRFKPSV